MYCNWIWQKNSSIKKETTSLFLCVEAGGNNTFITIFTSPMSFFWEMKKFEYLIMRWGRHWSNLPLCRFCLAPSFSLKIGPRRKSCFFMHNQRLSPLFRTHTHTHTLKRSNFIYAMLEPLDSVTQFRNMTLNVECY